MDICSSENRKESSLRAGMQSDSVLNRLSSHIVVWCFALLAVMVLFHSCSSTKVVTQLPWQESRITIDGVANDWAVPLKYHTQDAKVQYGISNDKENLYFCLQASDDQTQTKLLLNGLEFAIDTAGAKSKHSVLKYPLADTERLKMKSFGLNEMQDIAEMRLKILAEPKEVEVKGFYSIPVNGRLLLEEQTGIEATINWDGYNILVYELKIPLKRFLKTNSLDRQLGISWTIKGMPQPQMPSGIQGGGMPGGGRMGGGMPPGGVPPNGMPPRGMPSGMDKSLFESTGAHLKVTLAKM